MFRAKILYTQMSSFIKYCKSISKMKLPLEYIVVGKYKLFRAA